MAQPRGCQSCSGVQPVFPENRLALRQIASSGLRVERVSGVRHVVPCIRAVVVAIVASTVIRAARCPHESGCHRASGRSFTTCTSFRSCSAGVRQRLCESCVSHPCRIAACIGPGREGRALATPIAQGCHRAGVEAAITCCDHATAGYCRHKPPWSRMRSGGLPCRSRAGCRRHLSKSIASLHLRCQYAKGSGVFSAARVRRSQPHVRR